jgi:glycosyltransferase involved in cell wall biosynthesis
VGARNETRERLRVLVSAYACEPGQGSEPGVGWTFARAAALHHEVWLLTRANLAEGIERARRQEPDLHLHPVYLDLPGWVLRWKGGLRGVHWYYPLWQLAAHRLAQRLHRTIGFDLVHHLTFAADWMPVGVAGIDDAAFIWGPVGGATGVPLPLWRWLGWQGCLAEAARELTTRPARWLFARPAARRAALLVAQNHDVAKAFPRARRVVVEPNVAIEDGAVPLDVGPDREPGRRRAVFAGRLLAWKGAQLAVACLARPEAAGWTLDVYGAGPEAERIRHLAGRLGVSDRVTFQGERSRAEVRAAMATADALLYPSMRDAASWVAAEALTAGCPVVCLDRGGPAVLVGPGEGVKVPVHGDVVANLAAALASITARVPPVKRWRGDRLPELVASWYEQAVGAAAEVRPPSAAT